MRPEVPQSGEWRMGTMGLEPRDLPSQARSEIWERLQTLDWPTINERSEVLWASIEADEGVDLSWSWSAGLLGLIDPDFRRHQPMPDSTRRAIVNSIRETSWSAVTRGRLVPKSTLLLVGDLALEDAPWLAANLGRDERGFLAKALRLNAELHRNHQITLPINETVWLARIVPVPEVTAEVARSAAPALDQQLRKITTESSEPPGSWAGRRFVRVWAHLLMAGIDRFGHDEANWHRLIDEIRVVPIPSSELDMHAAVIDAGGIEPNPVTGRWQLKQPAPATQASVPDRRKVTA